MDAKEMVPQEKKEVKRTGEEMRPGPVFIPAVDILENQNEIMILADMPGVDGKDVDIDLRNDILTIRGPVSPVEDEKEVSVYREYSWGDYFRQFTLAEMIDQGKISAKMDNGVLRLNLPKKEKVKPKKIEVSVS
ncbi:MAG: heat shock protein Hsp20 [Deltaproteobacteria bacterium]|jgi:HSP20 family molecular chaperone IbpA|nr:heat shock protein Hsp20 [Deltaproteobacteria bacterium]